MTEIRRMYRGLNRKSKLLLAAFTSIMVILTYVVAGFASSSAFSLHMPAKDGSAGANPTVSVYVKHTAKLDAGTVSATINGESVTATLQHKGYWTEDYDTAEMTYTVTDEKEGTITVGAKNLNDGPQTVTVNVRGADGLLLSDTWSFTVVQPPQITSLYPANGSEMKTLDKLTAKITDNTAVDWSNVILTVNGSVVEYTYDQNTGVLTYSGPFANSNYKITLDAQDLAGSKARQAAWSFTVDSEPPILSEVKYVQDGMNITGGLLKFYAQLNDLVDIKNNATLKLNGELLPAEFLYKGEWNYDGDEYYIHSKKDAYLSYEGKIAPGSYTLVLYVEDKLGHSKEYSWTFTAGSHATITKQTPVTYGIKERKPTISAVYSGTGEITSIVMKVNGQPVDHKFNAATGSISYTPSEFLADESYHTVSLAVVDHTGSVTESNWGFLVNTFPDMADSSMDTCTTCHDLYPFSGSAGPYEDVHGRRLSFYDSHNSPWDCSRCHNYINVEAGCQQCHGDFLYNPPTYDYAPHGSTPSIQYQLTKYDQLFPLRVLQNREMFDCVICHQPGVSITRYAGGTLGIHDIPQLHKTSDAGCAPCHAQSLTREHARVGRMDKNGNVVNCNTCHKSNDSITQNAISTKDTSCTACHTLSSTGAAHSEYHVVSYGAKCVECHGDNMMSEKQYHGAAGCGVCHESTDSKVRDAIKWQKNSCFDCHEQPHSVYMSTMRDDIPLYSSVSWGTPQDATLWSGESWLPDELNNSFASLVFSSRKALIEATVYEYYKSAMQAAGWSLQNENYTSGAGCFTLNYTKGRRYATVWYYTGTTPGTAGEGKARIQISYF